MVIALYLLKAWLIGMAIAAPVGPVGMMCIRKTLELGVLGTIAVGLGAACADGVYGLIAALGLTTLSHFLLAQALHIKIIGGTFLLYLAYKDLKVPSKKISVVPMSKHKKFARLISEVFFLTLTSPLTILSFIGIFSSIGGSCVSFLEAITMMIGVFLGSITWWLILGSIVIKIKHRLPDTWIHRIRYISALILGGFGVWAIGSGLLTYFSQETMCLK